MAVFRRVRDEIRQEVFELLTYGRQR
jgi:hypothetical protein